MLEVCWQKECEEEEEEECEEEEEEEEQECEEEQEVSESLFCTGAALSCPCSVSMGVSAWESSQAQSYPG